MGGLRNRSLFAAAVMLGSLGAVSIQQQRASRKKRNVKRHRAAQRG